MVNGPRVLGVVLLICGLLILFFKADWLIAGYNTMTEAEKAEGFGSDPPSAGRWHWLDRFWSDAVDSVLFYSIIIHL